MERVEEEESGWEEWRWEVVGGERGVLEAERASSSGSADRVRCRGEERAVVGEDDGESFELWVGGK